MSRQDVDQLAAEYLEQLEAGLNPDLERFAARLPDAGERPALRRLVGAAQALQGVLPSQLRPGLVFASRYRIIREIGAGGMGKVFEVEDTRLDRLVALKVMAAMPGGSAQAEELFARESRLLAALQHPNIVTIHEVGREGDVDYFVMDLVRGTPLSEVIDRARQAGGGRAPERGDALLAAIGLPSPELADTLVEAGSWWRSVARVMAEVARTIESAHGHGIVHRDIKPGNVMLRCDATPVILDFGLAATRDSGGGSVTRGLFGSVAYLAPEQATRMSSGAEPTTDVYQLGLLLHELLVLQRAVPDGSMTQMLERISMGRLEPPRSVDRRIPADLAAICQMATELDPRRRYPSASALREDLQRYLAGTMPPLATRGAHARRLRYAVRRHSRALITGAAVLIGLIGGGILLSRTVTHEIERASFEPIRLDARDGSLQLAALGDPVRADDLLGVRVRTETPTWLYAVSVFGEGEAPTWVAPMQPTHLAGVDDAGRVIEQAAEKWALPVPAGTSDVLCTRIDSAAPDGGIEGLWVFASSRPVPQLERWLDSLELAALHADSGKVGIEEARRLFEQPSATLTRGGQPLLSEPEREAVAQGLTAAGVVGEQEWDLADPRRFQVYFRVQQAVR